MRGNINFVDRAVDCDSIRFGAERTRCEYDALDQLARAIAHTIGGQHGPLAGCSAHFLTAQTVQGTKVIIHFTVKDSALLAKAKSGSDHMRETNASIFCRDPQKAAPLKRGISLIYSYELADKSDRIEFTIDAAACTSLATVKPASAAELSQLARQAVNELRSDEIRPNNLNGA